MNGQLSDTERVALRFLLHNIESEQKHHRGLLEQILKQLATMTMGFQAMLAVAARSERQGKRLKTAIGRLDALEKGAPPPMRERASSHAEHESGADDSGVHEAAIIKVALAEFERFKAKAEAREQFWYEKRWNLVFAVVGGLLALTLAACAGAAAPRVIQTVWPSPAPSK
jgi:hypothetical protein